MRLRFFSAGSKALLRRVRDRACRGRRRTLPTIRLERVHRSSRRAPSWAARHNRRYRVARRYRALAIPPRHNRAPRESSRPRWDHRDYHGRFWLAIFKSCRGTLAADDTHSDIKPAGAAGQLIRCHARRAAEAKPMSDRLSLSQVAALMAYAATTAGGQLLFKTPALRGADDGPLAERIAGFLLNGYFFVALILYAALTVLWVWILSFTQLSRTYLVPRACICVTPALGCLVFAEPLRYGSSSASVRS